MVYQVRDGVSQRRVLHEGHTPQPLQAKTAVSETDYDPIRLEHLVGELPVRPRSMSRCCPGSIG